MTSTTARASAEIVDENGKEIVYDDEKKEESAPSNETSQGESVSTVEENGKANANAKKHIKHKKNK